MSRLKLQSRIFFLESILHQPGVHVNIKGIGAIALLLIET